MLRNGVLPLRLKDSSILYSPSSLNPKINCGRVKLIRATLRKKITNADHATTGLNTMRLAMIELPINIIKSDGMNAARKVNTTVQVGKLLRMAVRGRLGAVAYQSENRFQSGALIKPISTPKPRINARIKQSPSSVNTNPNATRKISRITRRSGPNKVNNAPMARKGKRIILVNAVSSAFSFSFRPFFTLDSMLESVTGSPCIFIFSVIVLASGNTISKTI